MDRMVLGGASTDLRRTTICFRDMNARLKTFRTWAGTVRKLDQIVVLAAGNEGAGPSVLLTEQELRNIRTMKDQKLREALWDRASRMIVAKRMERDALASELSCQTAAAQSEVKIQVAAAVQDEEKYAAEVRGKRKVVELEISTLQEELSNKKDQEEEETEQEDERVSRENANANKRYRSGEISAPMDVKEKMACIEQAICDRKERLQELEVLLSTQKNMRMEDEVQMRERHAELAALKDQSKIYEAGHSLDEEIQIVKHDRERELKGLQACGDTSALDCKRDALLRHLVSLLKDDASSPEQMIAIEGLLQAAYGLSRGSSVCGSGSTASWHEARAAAAAALHAKTGLAL